MNRQPFRFTFLALTVMFSSIGLVSNLSAQSSEARSIASFPLLQSSVDQIDIELDGQLDESVWASIKPIGEFGTVEPDTLVAGKYPTEVRAFYTKKGIYVGFSMHQPQDTLVTRLSSRDQRQLNRDAVFITFDSSSEARYGYWFGIALGDSLMDGTILPERRYASDWDGPWWGATAVTDYGWSAEMFLPWSMMSMPQADAVRDMGVYVSRKVAHLNERWAWPALPSTEPQFLSVLDQIQVEDVAPRQQYNIFPYTSSTVDKVDDDTTYKAGVDLFWRPSTDFQMSATVNPDFGSVEADDVIVNLTAFETFFPEKRLFFLEGQEVFIATPRATSGNPTTLLNTRRIGGRAFPPTVPSGVTLSAAERGQPAELDGALKMTGEGSGLRYGVLTAFENETRFMGTDDVTGNPVRLDQDGRDVAVARLLYEDSASGATRGLGWMSTAVTHPNRDAFVHSIDGHYLSNTGKFQFDGQVIYSSIEDEIPSRDVGDGVGGFVDFRYTPQRGRNHIFAAEYFDEQVNINDLGFFRRNDLMSVRYIWQETQSDISFGRDVNSRLMVPLEWNTDKQGTRLGVFWSGDLVRNDLSEWHMELNWFPDRYEDRNSFGNGAYKIKKRGQFALGYSTDSSKPVSLSFDFRREGEEFGGQHYSGKTGITWRATDQATLDMSVFYRVRDRWLLHSGGTNMTTFDADEWNLRLSFDYFATARQQLRASLQWVAINAEEDEYYTIPSRADFLIRQSILPTDPSRNFSLSTLNLQLRYRWEIAPMSDLFVVYTKNGLVGADETDSFGQLFSDANDMPVSEQLVIKLRYRFGS